MQKAWLVLHLQILSICKRTVGKPHKYKDDATVAKGSCLCPVLPAEISMKKPGTGVCQNSVHWERK